MDGIGLDAGMPHLRHRDFFGRDRKLENVDSTGWWRVAQFALLVLRLFTVTAQKRSGHERDQIGSARHG